MRTKDIHYRLRGGGEGGGGGGEGEGKNRKCLQLSSEAAAMLQHQRQAPSAQQILETLGEKGTKRGKRHIGTLGRDVSVAGATRLLSINFD